MAGRWRGGHSPWPDPALLLPQRRRRTATSPGPNDGTGPQAAPNGGGAGGSWPHGARPGGLGSPTMDSVYAFDADTGAVLWHVSLLAAGEAMSDTHGCGQVTPQIGITSTPVIDRGAGAHGTIFVVAMSKDASSNYHQRLHALDLTTGAELLGGPTEIAATFPAGGGTTYLQPRTVRRARRPAAVERHHLHQLDVALRRRSLRGLDHRLFREHLGPDRRAQRCAEQRSAGPAIWMSGGGPAADAAGNVYLLTANGVFETTLDANGFPNRQITATPSSRSPTPPDFERRRLFRDVQRSRRIECRIRIWAQAAPCCCRT